MKGDIANAVIPKAPKIVRQINDGKQDVVYKDKADKQCGRWHSKDEKLD